MCGRFTLFAPAAEVADAFAVAVPELFPRYNIAPSQPVAVVRAAPGGRELVVCQWGLVPSWSKDGKGFINARAETAHDKPAFRGAFARRRCLVPADGWYEWKAEGKRKQPYFFGPADGRPLAFAGLWEAGRAGGALDTCAILTTCASELAAPVHDRMPVILPPEAYAAWLDHGNGDAVSLRGWLRPFPAGALFIRRVGTLVNSPRNDDARCLQEERDLFGQPGSGSLTQ
jgi:putative SOS response-associated peptidase YedK